jgi:DNA-binding transcriptional regulator YdaS (Cro superfamily)
MKLNEYLQRENITQAALGEFLGVSQGAVAQWFLPNRNVPAEHCPSIEKWSLKEVTCEEMCTSVNWSYLRKTHRSK